jgi:osmotically-inducible protein OsmY
MTDLTDRITEALSQDPRLKGSNIGVASNRSVVTLSGSIKTAALRDAAEEIAKRMDGVTMVINEIKVA